jgi:hypothetical protein
LQRLQVIQTGPQSSKLLAWRFLRMLGIEQVSIPDRCERNLDHVGQHVGDKLRLGERNVLRLVSPPAMQSLKRGFRGGGAPVGVRLRLLGAT